MKDLTPEVIARAIVQQDVRRGSFMEYAAEFTELAQCCPECGEPTITRPDTRCIECRHCRICGSYGHPQGIHERVGG